MLYLRPVTPLATKAFKSIIISSSCLCNFCDLNKNKQHPLDKLETSGAFHHNLLPLIQFHQQLTLNPRKQWAFDGFLRAKKKEKYINDALWQSALIRRAPPEHKSFSAIDFPVGLWRATHGESSSPGSCWETHYGAVSCLAMHPASFFKHMRSSLLHRVLTVHRILRALPLAHNPKGSLANCPQET